MSSVFSRKITMSTFSGCFTGDGTPANHRTGRRHTYRSRSWRRVTLSERMPPPTGVVSGPLMPIRYSLNVSTVSSGSQLPVSLNAFSPASTSFHSIALPCFFADASRTSFAAGQMSTPVPSPSMNGMMGLSLTCRVPSGAEVIRSAIGSAAYWRSEKGAPGRSAQQTALPLVAHLKGVVHERARLLHRARGLGLEQTQQPFVADHLLHQDGLGSPTRPDRGLEARFDAQQRRPFEHRRVHLTPERGVVVERR